MKKAPITAIVLTKNEEQKIERCVLSLGFCKEIIVIDDFSTDDTVKLAKKLHVLVYKHKLNNNFAQQRNFGLSKASYEWVLFVDADEVVSEELCRELSAPSLNDDFDGYFIGRRDVFLDRIMTGGEFGRIKLLRFGKKSCGKWVRAVHEEWQIDGELGETKNFLLHYSHEDISQFITQISFHASLHAKEKNKKIPKIGLERIILYPIFKFFRNFVFLEGYKDSTTGFVLAVFMSFHSFLSWSSIWILQKQKK